MKEKNKLVIIYLPNGKEAKYCTKDLGSDYDVAQTIECDPGEVKIGLKEDGKVIGRAYVGMPYYLEIF